MVEPADLPVSDVSEIADQLFIASRLHARHVEHVRDLGIDLILSTIWLAPTRALRRRPLHTSSGGSAHSRRTGSTARGRRRPDVRASKEVADMRVKVIINPAAGQA